MFLVQVEFPYIGQHKWTSFFTKLFVVDKKTKKEVTDFLSSMLPVKDLEVERALYEQDKRKTGEYYSVKLHAIPKGSYIDIEPTTFPKPFEKIWL